MTQKIIPDLPLASQVADETKFPVDDGTVSKKVTGRQISVFVLPPGFMMEFGGESAPEGWLVCDGAAVSRTTYAALYAAIGDLWGAGDGLTTFNLPDRRRRVAVGAGGSGTATLGNSVGDVGGEETHALTTAEMPAHTHAAGSFAAASGGGHTHSVTLKALNTGPGAISFVDGDTSPNGAASTTNLPGAGTTDNPGGHTHSISGTSGSAGGAGSPAHNNLQPSAVVLVVIKT